MRRGTTAAVVGAAALVGAVGLALRERDPVERGRALARKGDHEAAFAAWRAACDERNARACAAAGAAHLSAGELDLAREMSARADAIDAKSLEGMLLRGAIALADGKRVEAREIYGEAETLHPYSGMASANLAMMDLEEGNVAAARLNADRAWKANPNLAMAYAVRARIFMVNGGWDAAADAYRIALSLDPSPQYRLELADALGRIGGRDAERVQLLSEAVEALPGDADARIAYGQALAQTGRYDEAIEELRAAAELAPDQVEPHLFLAEAFLDKGQPEFAEARVRKALEIDPKSLDAAFLLAEALIAQGKLEETITVLDAFLARDGLEPELRREVRLRRASILSRQGRDDLARRDLEAVLAEDPNDFDANLHLGHMLVEGGKHAAARAPIEKALAKSASDPRAVFDHARILAALGDHDGAIRELQALVSMAGLRADEVRAQPEFKALGERVEFRLLLEGASSTPVASPAP